MTVVPLPDTNCVRVRQVWNEGTNGEGSNRFYLAYAGSAPTPGNCSTIASDIAAAWASHLAPLANNYVTLNEVDVLDISTDTGNSGQWTGSNGGSRGTDNLPDNCAVNIEFGIARRYRGGKPRIYLAAPIQTDQGNPSAWSTDFLTAAASGWAAYIAEVVALSVGAVGALEHINLSYYKGFTNIMNSSGRERAVPTYRATALSDPVESYSVKAIIGSQRRRRTSTTP